MHLAPGARRARPEGRSVEVERPEDPVFELDAERVARHSLDDEPEDNVARVRVREAGARREPGPMRVRKLDELARGVVVREVAAAVGREEPPVAPVVVQPAPVPEQLLHGDLAAVGDEAR